MHTDDHILQSFVAAKGPLPTLAVDLGMTFIALVQWIDRNADLLAVAKRAMETHIAFLALRAEAAALVDLTQVSRSTTNEERKRKSASQLLRHSAKRLLTAVGAPPSPRDASPPPSPRQVGGGEKSLSTGGARGMRGVPIAPSTVTASLDDSMPSSSTNPEPVGGKLRTPCGPESPADLLQALASRSPLDGLDASIPPALMPSSLPNAECPVPNASSQPNALSFSDREIDVLMVTLARHFNIDLTSDDAEPEPDSVASNAGPASRQQSDG